MIERYSRPDMARLWSEEEKLRTWLEVELAVVEALERYDEAPPGTAASIRHRAVIDPARAAALETTLKHDVIAFLTSVSEGLGDESRWLHYGMTSSDLLDTALAMVASAGSAQWGSNWGSKFNGVSTGLIGSDLNMYLFEQTTGASAFGPTNPANQPSTYASILQDGNQVFANLDMNGNLTMAATVPEAETYAMMLAGLGLVGFMVARRRQA